MIQNISKKPRYNLSVVLQETGMKADTLRAWERRYNLPEPDRSEGGHRLFSDYDIAVIKWLQARQDEGMRISQAVDLWREIETSGENPLNQMTSIKEPTAFPAIADIGDLTLDDLKDQWIEAALQYDESTADHILARAFAQFPMETVCTDLLYPAFSEIGTLWYQGDITVQQEHFTSELAVRKLQALIASAPIATHPQKILIGCPAGEYHTISALMITLLLRYRGWNVLYLGSNLPNDRLLDTIKETEPDLVIMTATRLATAAALRETALLLLEQGQPLAFGGWIFNQEEKLPELIPAQYLGDSLHDAIPLVEKLVFTGQPDFQPIDDNNPYQETKQAFLNQRSLIEIQALNYINDSKDIKLLASRFQGANEFLAQDIVAALSLGNISLLGSNLKWASGLLNNRGLSQELFQEYLKVYQKAVDEQLGESGEPIINWLTMVNSNDQVGS